MIGVTTQEKANGQILMPKRERIRVERVEGSRNRVEERSDLLIWYDSRQLEKTSDMAGRLSHLRYTGIVLYPDNLDTLSPVFGHHLTKVVHFRDENELNGFVNHPLLAKEKGEVVISSADLKVLAQAKLMELPTCYRAYVDDSASLHESIEKGSQHTYLMVSFRDPTNIPLELVIASLQATQTILIKEITNPQDAEDAIVTLGVMEVGADGVMYSPQEHARLDEFLSRLDTVKAPHIRIETGTVIRTSAVGMGYRSCIDLATLFSPTEGMLVGSTSQGGILCCPEVFFLPYMELRPFRVNAGAVHSYVYNVDNRTDYMTELRAGVSAMIVDTQGKVRRACVGRMKTEVRPLRLIEVEFPGGERVNVIMQDDWHVRIFSDKSTPLNITELKPGDKVLGHVAQPGRHVGIKVDEHIVEN